MSAGETCRTCVHYGVQSPSVEGGPSSGYCRANPPQHSDIGGSIFPHVTSETLACGEHPVRRVFMVRLLTETVLDTLVTSYDTMLPRILSLAAKFEKIGEVPEATDELHQGGPGKP